MDSPPLSAPSKHRVFIAFSTYFLVFLSVAFIESLYLNHVFQEFNYNREAEMLFGAVGVIYLPSYVSMIVLYPLILSALFDAEATLLYRRMKRLLLASVSAALLLDTAYHLLAGRVLSQDATGMEIHLFFLVVFLMDAVLSITLIALLLLSPYHFLGLRGGYARYLRNHWKTLLIGHLAAVLAMLVAGGVAYIIAGMLGLDAIYLVQPFEEATPVVRGIMEDVMPRLSDVFIQAAAGVSGLYAYSKIVSQRMKA